jgi:hypothetical protein
MCKNTFEAEARCFSYDEITAFNCQKNVKQTQAYINRAK